MKLVFLLTHFTFLYCKTLNQEDQLRGERKIVKFDVLDENLDLDVEDIKEKAFNYIKTAFSPNTPIPSSVPTTFMWSPSSQLKPHFPPGVSINPGLERFRLPTDYDFHSFDSEDILAPLYEHELKLESRRQDGLVSRDPMLVDKSQLKLLLRSGFTLPRHNQRNISLTNSVGGFIMRRFGTLGLLTGTQVFSPSQFREKFWEPGETIAEGLNLIGLYPGAKFNTSEDKIIVVGAHWDTTGFTDGFNDNGSGVAAMLETARALTQSGCHLQYTVIFVAFDQEEVGAQGSHEFVRSFLIPRFFLTDHPPQFQGAFILDTALNYNNSENSQDFPSSWSDQLAGDALRETTRDGFRGDFLSLISREQPESELVKTVEKHWNALKQDRQFRENTNINPRKFKLRKMPTTLEDKMPPLENLTNYVNFLRSDHVRFWFVNEFEYQMSLKSVLLTDTGPLRGVMKVCYHRGCDSARVGRTLDNEENFDFLSSTVQTLIDTVVELSGAVCPLSDRLEIKNKNSNLDLLEISPRVESLEIIQRNKYNAKYLREPSESEIYV